ncbi:MAG: DUF3857 domain-containing protein [Pyrinomonadaceae bacterium]|nr:DUF3857 domain-containing protein [Pyrinomonadaceae bacterium]
MFRLKISPLCLVYFLFTFLLFVIPTLADDKDWKPITPKELEMKKPQVEPDADAEAIFWEVRIDDSSEANLTKQHYVRVKIFTERGREKYSKFDIPFYKGLKIKDIMARVIKPDGSIVEISKNDIFEREIVKADKVKIKAKSFAVPGIEAGVIVEYRYKEIFEDASARGLSLEFQKDIPLQRIAYYYKPYNNREPMYQAYNFKDTEFEKGEKADKGFYLAERFDVPAYKEEPQMPPEDTVRPWILIQGVSVNAVDATAFGITYTVKIPGIPELYWGGVAGERNGITKWMTKSNKEIKQKAAELTTGAANDDEKLRKLYDFCQTQIRNTSFDTTLTDEQREKLPQNRSPGDILKNKVASSRFIDLLFGAMASSLGFDTRISYSGDRSKIIFNPKMTNEAFIHHSAIAIKNGENWKFFNPGVPFLPFGKLVWYEENAWSIIIGEKDFVWYQTPLPAPEYSNSKRTGKFKLSEDGTLEGEARLEFTGQTALVSRLDMYDESPAKQEESVKEEIKANMTTAEVSDIKIENLNDISKPLVYSYKIRVPNYATKTGKRLFFQPGYFEYGEKPLFTSATRTNDVYFRYPWSENDEIEFSLPANYALDNADAPQGFSEPQNITKLDINIGVTKDQATMIYKRQFFFGRGIVLFPKNSYSSVKNIFDIFNKTDSHTISLKQK